MPLVATPVGGLAESIEGPGIGVMAREVSAGAIAEAIRTFFATRPESFVRNIGKVKAGQTWAALADAIVLFSQEK